MAFDTRIKSNFRTYMAQSLINDFSALSDSRYFLFFGRNFMWENEVRPDPVIDCVRGDLDAWLDMLGAIRIAETDVSLVISRNPWTSGVVYTQYDDSINLVNPFNPKKFYVSTSENKVYKCISNNGNSPSTVQPSSTSVGIFCTADGYKWKFMYQIADDIYYKFATDTKVPVEYIEDAINALLSPQRSLQLAVQDAAIPGSIDNVVIESLGDSFPYANIAPNLVVGAPGMIGSKVVYLNTTGLYLPSDINDIVGYSVYFNFGLGAGQVHEIEAAELSGNLLKVTLVEPLVKPVSSVTTSTVSVTSYQIIPTAKISGDGVGCRLVCKVSGITGTGSAGCAQVYQIDTIDVLNSGKDYTNATITITPTTALAPVVRAIISPANGHGSNAVVELGASEMMVYCSSRSGIAGDLPYMNNFRQFGLIRNPKLGRGLNAGEFAGNESVDGFRLRIKKPEVIVIKIRFSPGGSVDQHTYTSPDGDFKLGQLVKQNTTGASGRVVQWIPPIAVNTGDCCDTVGGGDPTGYLYIEPTENSLGLFVNSPTQAYAIVGYDDLGVASGPSYWYFQPTNNFVPTIGYTGETFDAGKFVIGVESLTTAKIVGWEVGPEAQDGYLILSAVKGKFRGHTVDAFGNFVEGERLVQIASIDPYSGIWSINNVSSGGINETNIGIVTNSPLRETFGRSTYSQTYKVDVTAITGNPDLIDNNGASLLSLDSTIDILEWVTGTGTGPGSVGAEYKKLGTASVVDYTISVDYPNPQKVHLELTSLRGWDRTFKPGAYGTLLGYGENENGEPVYIFTVDSNAVTLPDLKINSGEIVYIDHIRAITRNPERLEEFKLILRF